MKLTTAQAKIIADAPKRQIKAREWEARMIARIQKMEREVEEFSNKVDRLEARIDSLGL